MRSDYGTRREKALLKLRLSQPSSFFLVKQLSIRPSGRGKREEPHFIMFTLFPCLCAWRLCTHTQFSCSYLAAFVGQNESDISLCQLLGDHQSDRWAKDDASALSDKSTHACTCFNACNSRWCMNLLRGGGQYGSNPISASRDLIRHTTPFFSSLPTAFPNNACVEKCERASVK